MDAPDGANGGRLVSWSRDSLIAVAQYSDDGLAAVGQGRSDVQEIPVFCWGGKALRPTHQQIFISGLKRTMIQSPPSAQAYAEEKRLRRVVPVASPLALWVGWSARARACVCV